MISLLIDTCSHNLIVSLYKDDVEIITYIEETDNHLSERLLPLIDKAVRKGNYKINDIDNIIVANGPGSFTGIRVGVTVSKTLAYSIGCKIYTVSELLIMASGNYGNKNVVPLIDARRDNVYYGVYDCNLNNIVNDEFKSIVDVLNCIDSKESVFVSYDTFDGIEIIHPIINIKRVINYATNTDSIIPHDVNPNYLKRTEAEEKLNKND